MTYEPLRNTTIIGLGHRARHGKDSAAKFLTSRYPYVVQRFAFADALYSYCRVEHGMTVKDGPLLQRVGVEMRDRDPETWVRNVYWQIRDAAPTVAVITDVRFPNEMEFIKSLGGHTVKIERLMPNGSLFVAADRDPNHISEIALRDASWDFVIRVPDGSMNELQRHINDVYDYISIPDGAFRSCLSTRMNASHVNIGQNASR